MELHNRIFIIGFMGAGKSTLAERLANDLSYQFLDTDEIICKLCNTDIDSIFSKYGEEHFREIESLVLKRLLNKDNIVVATGGGLPCFNNNLSLINESSVSIYLKCSDKVLIERLVFNKSHRPLVKSLNTLALEEYVKSELEKRSDFYEQARVIVGNNDKLEETLKSMHHEINRLYQK